MPQATRNIRVTFNKTGPILKRDKICVLETETADPTHSVGDTWIKEDIYFAAVYLAVPYFPDEQNEPQSVSNGMEWRKRAEDAYREKHQGEPLVFQ